MTTNKSTNEWQEKLKELYVNFFKEKKVKNKLRKVKKIRNKLKEGKERHYKLLYLTGDEEYSWILEERTDANYPFLLSISDEFAERWNKCSKRVMIIGMEPGRWCSEIDDNVKNDDELIDAIMKAYEDFYYTDEKWKYGKNFFWNCFYAITELLKIKYNDNIEVLWNNYWKWGEKNEYEEDKYGSGVTPMLKNVLMEEIKILVPDLIIAFSEGKFCLYLEDNVLKSQENIEKVYCDDKQCKTHLSYKHKQLMFSYLKLFIQNKEIQIFECHPHLFSIKLLMDKMLEKLNKING